MKVLRLLILLSLILLIAQVIYYFHTKQQFDQIAKNNAQKSTQEVAIQLDQNFKNVENLAQEFADELSSGTIKKEDAMNHVQELMQKHPELNGLGVAFEPYGYDPNLRLYAPYYTRDDKGLTQKNIESVYDYTVANNAQNEWYYLPLKNGHQWVEPHFGRASQKLIAVFGTRFYKIDPTTNKTVPAGVVFLNYSLDDVHNILNGLNLGNNGYGYLLSQKGVYISHPNDEYVKDQKSIFQVAKELNKPELTNIGQQEIAGNSGSFEWNNDMTGQNSLIFYAPIPSTKWSLGSVFIQEESVHAVDSLRHQSIWICIHLVFFLWMLSIWLFKPIRNGVSGQWKVVCATTLLFAAGIGYIWYVAEQTPFEKGDMVAVVDQSGLDSFLKTKQDKALERHDKSPNIIPTGVQIETIQFGNADHITLTGYIWQKYPNDFPSDIAKGITLPDSTKQHISEAYRRKTPDGLTIGYRFKTTELVDFAYGKYPFDNNDVNLRIWPLDFDKNTLLAPDLASYKLLNPITKPGIEKDLTVTGWNIGQSFFNYSEQTYNQNFGNDQFATQTRAADLNFTFTVKRHFLNPFISNLLPIFVISGILFAILLMITKRKEFKEAFDYKTAGVLGTCSALFFSILLAHSKLRGDLGVSEIVYLEYFYFVLYAAILGVVINSFLYSANKRIWWVQFNDNIIPKLLFWPLTFGLDFFITVLVFY